MGRLTSGDKAVETRRRLVEYRLKKKRGEETQGLTQAGEVNTAKQLYSIACGDCKEKSQYKQHELRWCLGSLNKYHRVWSL